MKPLKKNMMSCMIIYIVKVVLICFKNIGSTHNEAQTQNTRAREQERLQQLRADAMNSQLESLRDLFTVIQPGLGAQPIPVRRGIRRTSGGEDNPQPNPDEEPYASANQFREHPPPRPPQPIGLTPAQIRGLPKFKFENSMAAGMFDW